MGYLKKNWKSLLLAAAAGGASVYGGPMAGSAVREYLPAICAVVGAC